MGKRFGRNQRRAAREALAQADRVSSDLRSALEMESGLTRHIREKLDDAKNQLKAVTEVLGEEFVGLHPVEAAYKASDIYAQDRFLLMVDDAAVPMHNLRVSHVSASDNPYHKIHLRAAIAGKSVGYVISEPALLGAPREFLYRRVAHEMARMLIDSLQGGDIRNRERG